MQDPDPDMEPKQSEKSDPDPNKNHFGSTPPQHLCVQDVREARPPRQLQADPDARPGAGIQQSILEQQAPLPGTRST
jgi:hypothetical protein